MRQKQAKTKTSASQLAAFIAKYTPEIARRARAVLARMRARLPGAVELVYDNYNALVVGFGPSERSSEAPFSIVLYPRWITLFFLQGAHLADPDRVLKGSGRQVRYVILETADTIDEPPVDALMREALRQVQWSPSGRRSRKLIIRAVMVKQRARRPPTAGGGRREHVRGRR